MMQLISLWKIMVKLIITEHGNKKGVKIWNFLYQNKFLIYTKK